MKYFLATALTLLFCAGGALAQEKKYEFQDVCGDPSVESVIFTALSGKVTKIIDGDTIVVRLSKGKERTVDLTGISAATNETAAKVFLTKTLLKKNVEIETGMNLMKAERSWGVVNLNDQEINRLMIENGIAAYRAPEPYEYSTYGNCVYRKLEEKAKREKVGMWTK